MIMTLTKINLYPSYLESSFSACHLISTQLDDFCKKINGRQPKMEDDQNGIRPKRKMTKMEDDQNGRRPKWKINKMEDDQNGRQLKLCPIIETPIDDQDFRAVPHRLHGIVIFVHHATNLSIFL